MPIEIKVFSSRKQRVEVEARPAEWQLYIIE